MAEQSELYKWFWKKMDALTASRPLTPKEIAENAREKSVQRFMRMRDNLALLNEFLSEAKSVTEELERTGVDVRWARSFVSKLLGPINILNHAVGASAEAVEAAQQVSLELAIWYKHAADQARVKANGDDDQYMIASAEIDRLWQARNVKAVLSADQNSFVMRLWPKWRDRLLSLVI
ncbi:hypothetical protein [Massilia sp. LjRoot122]|uniref:hypothetical protein n=1 Tax=Massilia sp. LjRoot122 TaxID=3342257 RepID=UPI003ECD5AC1